MGKVENVCREAVRASRRGRERPESLGRVRMAPGVDDAPGSVRKRPDAKNGGFSMYDIRGRLVRRPYDTAEYRRMRRRVLAGHPECWSCGEPATEADHQPPLLMHHHLGEGKGCCIVRASCARCARLQGARLRGSRLAWSVRIRPENLGSVRMGSDHDGGLGLSRKRLPGRETGVESPFPDRPHPKNWPPILRLSPSPLYRQRRSVALYGLPAPSLDRPGVGRAAQSAGLSASLAAPRLRPTLGAAESLA